MQVRIYTEGTDAVIQKLNASKTRATDTIPVIEKIVVDMLRIEGIIFSSDGRRGGGSWAALKPSTVKRKGSSAILRTAGAKKSYSRFGNNTLFKSLTEKDAPFQILKFTKNKIDFGTNRPDSALLQLGTSHMQARPFLKFTHADLVRWGAILGDHVTEPWRRGSNKANAR